MEYGILDVLTLIGSLGIFLYGMKLMSEALQKVAGQKMRSILATMTKNKFVGILSGILVTTLIQSSSATTVMVVSFVNAGLLNLTQAFSVIMGANIGTTATAWLIALLGFKIDISLLAVPIIAFSLPLLFSKHNNRRYIGELIFGFALIFMGIGLLKSSVPDIQSHPHILAFLQNYTQWGYGSVLLFLLVGSVLTVIVQSSSAVMAITLVMCSQGWIPYHMAIAMILGENIGTTITANIAALSGNIAAKRAAFSHFIFNIFGVCWALAVFYPFSNFVLHIVEIFRPTDSIEAAAFSLSLFHSIFNIFNVLILCWFSKYIVALVERIIRPKQQDTFSNTAEAFQLTYISTGLLSTAELSILQARKEVIAYAQRIRNMYNQLPDLIEETDTAEFSHKFEQIKQQEDASDHIEAEISKYIAAVSTGRLSSESKLNTQHILRIISEIESVADAAYKIACIVQRYREKNITWSHQHWEAIQQLMALTNKAVDGMINDLQTDTLSEQLLTEARNTEVHINNLRNQLLNNILIEVNEGKTEYQEGAYFQDVVRVLERIGDYVVNIIEAQSNHKLFKSL
ncbi:MAG: Na/Pi cotransporter family protein [Paludibacter sp.]|nr:Na/Pi cotransporter family protein [Bacteroidales bacterium]MCM1068573.1 Na/Pi cotransporter family protein [Prevotella sp.]MCM1353237.1 Na/Pi cotransporter family protein [Bacteroides sp.]MCM1442355.1 Na/Pi cotransporter family protein [Muribaculum sp.]MCM1481174.1 Na/Pi cotransporter family protein [Paludibacter sp.]